MKKSNFAVFLGAAAFLLLLAACDSLKLVSDYDKSVDFTKYKTFEFFGWAQNSNEYIPPNDQVLIEDAFAKEFYSRGLSINKDGADLIVSLFIVTEQKTEQTAHTSTYGGGYGGYYGYGPGYGWGRGYSSTYVTTTNYSVGTLIVSVFDKKEERLIWECTANKEIEKDPNRRIKTIPYVVSKIMQKYPVPAKKN